WKPCIRETIRIYLEAVHLDNQCVLTSKRNYQTEDIFINGSVASFFHIDYFLSVELPELEKIMHPIEIDNIVSIIKDFITLYPKPGDLDLFVWSDNSGGHCIFDNIVPNLFDYLPVKTYYGDFKGWVYQGALEGSSNMAHIFREEKNKMKQQLSLASAYASDAGGGGGPRGPPPLVFGRGEPKIYKIVVPEDPLGRYIFESIDYGYIQSSTLNLVPVSEPIKVTIYGCNVVDLKYLYDTYSHEPREKNTRRLTLLDYLISTIKDLNKRYPHLNLEKNHGM
ncbi:MAG: hypothetical protein EB127_22165, partial [Alphaproteobacteria bacterium]|nr:hypothetical protein [Alphaproteobacteria bacterium]